MLFDDDDDFVFPERARDRDGCIVEIFDQPALLLVGLIGRGIDEIGDLSGDAGTVTFRGDGGHQHQFGDADVDLKGLAGALFDAGAKRTLLRFRQLQCGVCDHGSHNYLLLFSVGWL